MSGLKNINVATDKTKLDLNMIHEFLTNSYWAKGRTLAEVKTCVEHSICFGLYLDEIQIGFGRVLSDGVAFAYLMDVFVLEPYRGQGLSKVLLAEIFDYPELKHITKWFLATRDAHDLYKTFGFHPVMHPERLMERLQLL